MIRSRNRVLILLYCIHQLYFPAFGRYVFFKNLIQWNTAYEICRLNGLALTKVDSDAKRQDILNFTEGSKTFGLPFQHIWIGLVYDAQESSYMWTDGTTLGSSFWRPKGPSMPLSDYPDVIMDIKSGKWTNKLPNTKSRFVCEERDPLDPPISVSEFKLSKSYSFIKWNSSISSIDGKSTASFSRGLKGRLHSYSEDVVLEDCLLRCTEDQQCVCAVYIVHPKGRDRSYCLLHKQK